MSECTPEPITLWKAAVNVHCPSIHYSFYLISVSLHKLHYPSKYFSVHYCMQIVPCGPRPVLGLFVTGTCWGLRPSYTPALHTLQCRFNSTHKFLWKESKTFSSTRPQHLSSSDGWTFVNIS